MQIQPYLFYNGRCDEAIDFYRAAVGAEVAMLMRFKDSPDPTSHGVEEKVMHASLRIGDATVLVSDGQCSGQLSFQGFALSLTVSDDAEGVEPGAGNHGIGNAILHSLLPGLGAKMSKRHPCVGDNPREHGQKSLMPRRGLETTSRSDACDPRAISWKAGTAPLAEAVMLRGNMNRRATAARPD